MEFKALSYNIHKGLNWNNTSHTLIDLKDFLHETNVDFVFLQEVVGENKILPKKFQTWVDNQHEFLADTLWQDYAYSKNAVYDHRHHGNAILSKYPIVKYDVIDLTIHSREMRALLHCEIESPKGKIDLFCTHLNLLHRHRVHQYEIINKSIEKINNGHRPLILAGDFNDWIKKSNQFIKGLFNAGLNKPNKTFPHNLPISALDHFYTRDVNVTEFKVLKPKIPLSDHLPIYLKGEVYGN
jgi:endonuclease/exonuclease/phosphatase family metal-dependent hydrolase